MKIHSLARKNEHLRINQIQLRFLHFNQHSITLLGIHMRHSLRKVSTSLHQPPKLPCRNLAITELCRCYRSTLVRGELDLGVKQNLEYLHLRL